MIVGCYTVDLYCDHPDGGKYACTHWPGQFTGKTERGCLGQARRQGWQVDDPDQVRCPKHAGGKAA